MIVEESLFNIMSTYQSSFTDKVYQEENDDSDLLMDAFALTQAIKRENKQYWGRELGMCWELMVAHVMEGYCKDFRSKFRIGHEEPCDMIVGDYAIDTKYRFGSGDSGTKKKFERYADLLRERGYVPVCLILRDDNLQTAINALKSSGWIVLTAEASYNFIRSLSGYDLKSYLKSMSGQFIVNRS